MRQNGVRSNVRFPYGSGMKKQGANDRLDESLGMRRGKSLQKHKVINLEEMNLEERVNNGKYRKNESFRRNGKN